MSGARSLVLVWLALVALITLSVGGAFVFTGIPNLVVSLGAAAIKAGLIFWFYMHLREEDWLNRIMALGALAWLAILLIMTGADYATRFLG